MDKITEVEIINFIEKEFWKSNLNSNSDIFKTVQISGDDCDELLFKYSEKYLVDMSDFLWYFHCDEEGSTFITGMFFKPPYKRVTRIPITPKMLTDFANSKIWKINYPEHTLPKKRYDILINKIIFLIILIWLISSLIKKYF